MNTKAILLILIIGFTVNFIENPCDIMFPREFDGDWGDGVYVIPDTFTAYLYNDFNKSKFGQFTTPYSGLLLTKEDGTKIRFERGDMEWIGHYSNELLKVRECENPRFLKTLWRSFPAGLYIDKEEFENSGARFYSYKQLLFKEETTKQLEEIIDRVSKGVNLTRSCLNLRESPTIESNKIFCIPSNDWNVTLEHSHIKILETYDNWAKVEVTTNVFDNRSSESGDDCIFKVKDQHIGWVRVIDDNGFPNIWFSVSGY